MRNRRWDRSFSTPPALRLCRLGVLGPTNSLAVNRLGSHVDAGSPFGFAVPFVQARADAAGALEP